MRISVQVGMMHSRKYQTELANPMRTVDELVNHRLKSEKIENATKKTKLKAQHSPRQIAEKNTLIRGKLAHTRKTTMMKFKKKLKNLRKNKLNCGIVNTRTNGNGLSALLSRRSAMLNRVVEIAPTGRRTLMFQIVILRPRRIAMDRPAAKN